MFMIFLQTMTSQKAVLEILSDLPHFWVQICPLNFFILGTHTHTHI